MADETRIAVLSDIHGNRWALEAVLEDIRRRGIERLLNLGDVLYGPLDPRGTGDLLIPSEIPTVLGNEDRIIVRPDQQERSSTLRFVLRELRKHHLEWLNGFPGSLVVDRTHFLCHGSPESDCNYLLWNVTPSGAHRRPNTAVRNALKDTRVPVVLCGHDHIPFSVRLPTGMLVVNPGSVGLPAYSDDGPYPHVMETGSPHARYALLGQSGGTWNAEHIAVSYDWESAAECAVQNGRRDWAVWLRTGRAETAQAVGEIVR